MYKKQPSSSQSSRVQSSWEYCLQFSVITTENLSLNIGLQKEETLEYSLNQTYTKAKWCQFIGIDHFELFFWVWIHEKLLKLDMCHMQVIFLKYLCFRWKRVQKKMLRCSIFHTITWIEAPKVSCPFCWILGFKIFFNWV